MNSERTGWPLRGRLGQCKFKKEIMFPGNEPLGPFLLCSPHLPHLLETSSSDVVNGAISVPGLPPIENLKKKNKKEKGKSLHMSKHSQIPGPYLSHVWAVGKYSAAQVSVISI